jgi:hypothetical protein
MFDGITVFMNFGEQAISIRDGSTRSRSNRMITFSPCSDTSRRTHLRHGSSPGRRSGSGQACHTQRLKTGGPCVTIADCQTVGLAGRCQPAFTAHDTGSTSRLGAARNSLRRSRVDSTGGERIRRGNLRSRHPHRVIPRQPYVCHDRMSRERSGTPEIGCPRQLGTVTVGCPRCYCAGVVRRGLGRPASRSFQFRIALNPRKNVPCVCQRQNGRMANMTT